MSGDEQTKLVITVPSYVASTFDTVLPPEIEDAVTSTIEQTTHRFAPISIVTGIGRSAMPKFAHDDWIMFNVGEALGIAETFTPMFTIEDFTCPISCCIFEVPVSFGGHFYEREALAQWFECAHARSSPLTRQVFESDGVTPLKILEPPRIFIAELAKFKASHTE